MDPQKGQRRTASSDLEQSPNSDTLVVTNSRKSEDEVIKKRKIFFFMYVVLYNACGNLQQRENEVDVLGTRLNDPSQAKVSIYYHGEVKYDTSAPKSTPVPEVK